MLCVEIAKQVKGVGGWATGFSAAVLQVATGGNHLMLPVQYPVEMIHSWVVATSVDGVTLLDFLTGGELGFSSRFFQ